MAAYYYQTIWSTRIASETTRTSGEVRGGEKQKKKKKWELTNLEV